MPNGADVTVEYRSQRYPSVPDWKDCELPPSPRTEATLDRICPSFRALYFGGYRGGYSCG
jgi:hypothetical protein